ncbi:MAG: glycosidase, partial [bacterium]
TAKGPRDHLGFYPVYPRAAYYVLRDAFRLDPYAPGTDLDAIRSHFGAIQPVIATHEAWSDDAKRITDATRRVSVTGVRAEFETFSTDGTNITTPPSENPQLGLPSYLGFGNQQSFYVDFQVSPAENIRANLSVNILGNIAANQIDEIFYENRGIDAELQFIDRVRAYNADVSWDDRWFRLDGFYRTGHYHWGYEGDFFGIYREAFYGENIDIYNAEAPIGVEMTGKKRLKDFKLAFGPQLWWGANPALFLKYQHSFGKTGVSALFHEEFAQQTDVTSTAAIPAPPTRRASVMVETSRGPVGLEVGGLWAGSTKKGEGFKIYEGTEKNYKILQDYIVASDALGAKAKVTYERGRWHWYAQGAYEGLVADGGPTATRTYTGWTLKDSNAGNQSNFITGLAVDVGRFQIAPNFLWQKPIVGPIPGFVEAPGRPRNTRDDPFVVRANRETTAGELVITYDPTPATWLWDWDNDVREDSRLAWSLGFVFRHQPTTQDVSFFFPGPDDDFTDPMPLPGAPPPKDLWEVRTRVVSRLGHNKRLAANVYFGNAEPNAWTYKNPDPLINRFIERFSMDARLTWGSVAFETFAKFNDWGPYDYHRDWNFTFPVHLMGDLSYSLGTPKWFGDPQTRVGMRGTWRSLDKYSNRYDAPADGENGTEWEIRTYLHIAL